MNRLWVYEHCIILSPVVIVSIFSFYIKDMENKRIVVIGAVQAA